MDEMKGVRLKLTKTRVNRWDGGFDGWGRSKGSNKEQKR